MLIRRAAGYSFRQRVPDGIRNVMGKNELWIALDTNDKALAKNRASAIFGLTNKLFARLKIVSNELAQSVNDTIRDIIDERFKPLFDTIISTYEAELSNLKSQYQVMNAEHLLERLEQDDAFLKFAGDANAEVNKIHQLMKDIPDLDIRKKMSDILGHFNNIESWTKPKEPQKSPLFSEASEAFIIASSKDWKDSDFRAYRSSIKRFLECCGDKEIRLYGGQDAGHFKELMEKLPENYGRNTKDTRTVPQLVKEADKKKSKRISGKSVKNHFSKMSSIWRYYLLRDLVDKNIFIGWNFDTKQKVKRVRWSDEYLEKLINASFDISTTISKETYAYIVGVGSYSGMRLEEICRIRIEDIQDIRGIPCIIIQEHEGTKKEPWTAWNPKSEAGARVVPIARKLIDAGFLDFVEKSRQMKSRYVFSELKFSGKDKKRSGLIQRNFSTHKSRLGIPATTVFHSFRHYVSTKLRNIHEHGDGGLREVWIDNFLGHEGNNKSVGNTVYLDEVDVENLKTVADSVVYPEFWDIKGLMK
ncbi:phage integrase [Komagataeibacter diospyri]|uniref:DUF6538 domain-containing protein n=1 Tax=Komagataeibacter diospyri TaxID=1932662 RepID=UPI0011391894|nr:DUF6538 domain-containing protein [Komagataeibacter diospyri]GCE90882.1 phage integrase [Komagataeibacter diospyri]